MSNTPLKKLVSVHQQAMIEFDIIQSSLRDERMQCLSDRRFYSIAGAQWEGALSEQFENRPKFEINKIHLSVIRIINQYRNNKVTVEFKSKDGSKNSELADTCNGLYRADEQDSCADEAYDNAFEEAVGGGFGAFRLRADYEDEEDEDNDSQRIYIEPIYDADSCVFFDLGAKRQDKSDAKHCFILKSMPKDEFEEEFGFAPVSVQKQVDKSEFDWSRPDFVYIAEYFKKEKIKKKIHTFQSLDGTETRYSDEDFENDPDLYEMLAATGSSKISERIAKTTRIHKYIISGNEVLEDLGFIAGKHIPVVPVYGKRWFVDGVERCMGHVRLSRDVQRLKNMQTSKLAEISSLSSVEKPILTPEQIAGHQQIWSEDNIKNYPYLLVNALEDAIGNPTIVGPTSYTRSPQIPPAMAALLQITDQDIKELLGNQEAGEEILSNASGKAVELVQSRLDMQSFIYISNMKKAIQRSGEIWLSMAKELFVESGRKMKTVNSADEVDQVELNQPFLDEKTGETKYNNDISSANFDVVVDVGPSSATKKTAAVRSLMEMLQITTDPQTIQVLSSMIMMNMEGEGVQEARDYFRNKLLKMGVVKPTKEEAETLAVELQNQQPDANEVYLMKAAENEEAKAAKARADTGLVVAKTDETRAKTAETLAGIDREDHQQVIDLAEKVQNAATVQPQ